MTGHDNGLITIALVEADDAERERRRTQMHEPYRSLLGHFRHEVAHYFSELCGRSNRERAVRIHAISVRSAASRLRSLASSLARLGASGLSLTGYPPRLARRTASGSITAPHFAYCRAMAMRIASSTETR
jgi:hypothetical protein